MYDTRKHVASIKPARRKKGEHVMDVSTHNLILAGDCKLCVANSHTTAFFFFFCFLFLSLFLLNICW